jgi:F-type H+-transporting ATPase subunit a
MSYTQNILEIAVEFIEQQVSAPTELTDKKYTPFFLSVFVFILFNNWVGIIPGSTPATGNITMTASLALFVFCYGTFLRFKGKGFFGFFKSLLPGGVTGVMSFLILPLEIVSQLLKPVSLAIRLFANISAGHLILLTIIGFNTLFGGLIVNVLSVAGVAVITLFELFVGFIQAYIFTMLSSLFISESIADSH